jgi:adenylate kinase
MRLVLLCLPGSGRETPAASLADALAVPHVQFGDLMRAHLSQGTELGIRSAEFMNSGRLLPDEIITAVVRDHLRQAAPAGFLLDGHPRSVAQASALDELFRELGTPLDGALHLCPTEEEVKRRVRRQAAHRLCRSEPTHSYVPELDPPVVDGVCNVCGGGLYQREEDSENSVRGRFSSHEAMMETITQHYARQHLLVTVDAVGTTDEITRRAITALREHGR